MHVLALANRADPELGLVGDRLALLGATVEHAFRETPGELPPLAGHDIVVALGSEWSVYDPAHDTAVRRESELLRACVNATVPVLGICFGAQLLAHALGGGVAPAQIPEIGWYAIRPRTVSDGNPGLDPGPYLQWHRDRFDPPPSAVVLADSPAGCQAFRLGSAFAVQFHPEATTPMIERWAAADRESLSAAGVDGQAIVTETARRQSEAARRAATLVDALLGYAKLPSDTGANKTSRMQTRMNRIPSSGATNLM